MDIDINEITKMIRETRPIIMRRGIHIREKGFADFVTEVDTGVRAFLKERLGERYPEIQFLGEEGAKERIDYSRPV